MVTISGFAVVRKPEHTARAYYGPTLRVRDQVYLGLDRLPWEDLDDLYYDRKLSGSLLEARDLLERENRHDLLGPRLLRDYRIAADVWRAFATKADLIAIWSPKIAEIKGEFSYDGNIKFLGFDCFGFGEWSVVLRGIFYKPDLFGGAFERLNGNGLLGSEEDCNSVFRQYVQLSSTELVEPLMDHPTATNIKIFAVTA